MAVLYCFANKEVRTLGGFSCPALGLSPTPAGGFATPSLALHSLRGGHGQGKAPVLSLSPTMAGEVRDEEEVAALEARPPDALLRPVMQ